MLRPTAANESGVQAKFFFFGRLDTSGHYLYEPGGRTVSSIESRALPFNYTILDGCLMPQNEPEIQGKTHLSIINGWTIVSMWDRTGDSRPRSNASFVAEGIRTREEVMEIARLVFPALVERIKPDLPPDVAASTLSRGNKNSSAASCAVKEEEEEKDLGLR